LGQASAAGAQVVALQRLSNPIALAIILGLSGGLIISLTVFELFGPDAVALELFDRQIRVERLHERVLEKALFVAIIPAAIFIFEYALVGWRESSIRLLLKGGSASGRSDVVLFLGAFLPGMHIVAAILTFGLAIVSAGWLRERIHDLTGLSISVAEAPHIAQVGGLFLLYTFFDYWAHRIEHREPFWPLHRYHHGAEDFYVLTAARVHPASFTTILTATVPGALVDATPDALADVTLLIMTLRLLIHSRIDSNFGWIGDFVIQSPRHHRLHHRVDHGGPATNLSMAPIWDRLFGTWKPDAHVTYAIGVDTPYRHGAWVAPDLARDYRDFWIGLGGAAKRLAGRRSV
jgi:sterol desaturase/sphingolipid hydroxylase (fatty acid hydroxylase superfamily)